MTEEQGLLATRLMQQEERCNDRRSLAPFVPPHQRCKRVGLNMLAMKCRACCTSLTVQAVRAPAPAG
eukprot:1158166-Pelagomonas_calceolata.AAC.13